MILKVSKHVIDVLFAFCQMYLYMYVSVHTHTHTHTHTQYLSFTMILKRRTYLPAWTWRERATGLPAELKTIKPVFQEPECKVSSCWIWKELFFTVTEAVSLRTLGFQRMDPWALIPRALLGERGPHQASEDPSLPSHWWSYFSGSL